MQYHHKFTSITILHPLWFMATFPVGNLANISSDGRTTFGIGVNGLEKYLPDKPPDVYVKGGILRSNKLKIWPEEYHSVFRRINFKLATRFMLNTGQEMTHQLSKVVIELLGESVQITGQVCELSDEDVDYSVFVAHEEVRMYLGNVNTNQSEITESWQKTEKKSGEA